MSHRFLAAALALFLTACGSTSPTAIVESVEQAFPGAAGQLPADYRLEATRGVILARVVVSTDGQPGLGGLDNPLLVEFQAPAARSRPPVLTPPGSGTHYWAAASERPSLWQYEPSGLLALSVAPQPYDALAIAYPDASHSADTPISLPAPSAALEFAPVDVPVGEIVYVGDIEIRQHVSIWDWFAGRIDVQYAVRDDYDATVADFRARYPQLADVAVLRRVARAAP